MAVLTDAEWSSLEAALAGLGTRGGRPFAAARRTVEAVVWRTRNGAMWRAIPAELGPWWRAAQLHWRWSRDGSWQRLLAALRDAGRPDLAEVFLDGSSVRAHRSAAGARGGRRARARPLARRLGHQGPRVRRRARARSRLPPPARPGERAERRPGPARRRPGARPRGPGRVRPRLFLRRLAREAWARGSAPSHDPAAHARRHRIENLWGRLKENRAVATRYDKTAAGFLGTLHPAAGLDRLHNRP
jgi:transposase